MLFSFYQSLGGASGKEPVKAGKMPWRRTQHPLQYSRLESPMDRGSWWATVHGVAKSQTRLKRLSTHRQGDLFSHNQLPSRDCFQATLLCPQLGLHPYQFRNRTPSGPTIAWTPSDCTPHALTPPAKQTKVFFQRAQKRTGGFLAYLPPTSRIRRLQYIHD